MKIFLNLRSCSRRTRIRLESAESNALRYSRRPWQLGSAKSEMSRTEDREKEGGRSPSESNFLRAPSVSPEKAIICIYLPDRLIPLYDRRPEGDNSMESHARLPFVEPCGVQTQHESISRGKTKEKCKNLLWEGYVCSAREMIISRSTFVNGRDLHTCSIGKWHNPEKCENLAKGVGFYALRAR